MLGNFIQTACSHNFRVSTQEAPKATAMRYTSLSLLAALLVLISWTCDAAPAADEVAGTSAAVSRPSGTRLGASAHIGGPMVSPPFNSSTLNHFCLVTRDFNATANAYAWLFGGVPPVGKPSLHSWLWYRGANTTALAWLVHAPGGPPGFTIEIISPQDDQPSIYNELLASQGNTVQHMGINVNPPGSIAAAQAAFIARGYDVVFAGQGSWGCFSYHWMRDDLGTIIELLDPGNLNCQAPT